MIGIPSLNVDVAVDVIEKVVPHDNGRFDIVCRNGQMTLDRSNLLIDVPSVGNYLIIPDRRLGLPMFVLTEERYKLFINQNLPT